MDTPGIDAVYFVLVIIVICIIKALFTNYSNSDYE